MRSLVSKVKSASVEYKHALNSIDYLDSALKNPNCQKLIHKMNSISLQQLNIQGPNDP